MTRLTVFALVLAYSASAMFTSSANEANVNAVAESDGLIAFWDFHHTEDDKWTSLHDPKLPVRPFPISIRQIGDPKSYSIKTWPNKDEASSLQFDATGPFGTAVRFNRGYLYGAVEREILDNSLLDLSGRRPFTMIAWAKFVGRRHLVAGIWDEGGWDKYGGQRQFALFAGLFGQQGTIAHVSATGAASFPQSIARGSQYARLRAIDGQAFESGQWGAMAMTFDPEKKEVRAYLNGKMTPLLLTDPVAQSVWQFKDEQAANPFHFSLPIYSPRAFVLKYNGYRTQDGISEHRLRIDLQNRRLTYEQDGAGSRTSKRFRVFFDIARNGTRILDREMMLDEPPGREVLIPDNVQVAPGDEIYSRLEAFKETAWEPVGEIVKVKVQAGAPFTFGRALGLGSEDPKHGSELYLDGVAVFNRVLSEQELKRLSFCNNEGHTVPPTK